MAAAAGAAAAAAAASGRERAEGGGDAPSPPLPPPSSRGQRADDTLDEATRKELCTDMYCQVCGAVLQFESQRIAHYEGKKHAQKVRLYLQMHSEPEGSQEPSTPKRQYVNFQMDPNVDKNTYCKLCNMIFTSPVVAQSHYLGKIHAKKLKQISGDPTQQSTQSTQPKSGAPAPSTLSDSPAEKASQAADAEDPASVSSKAAVDLDDPDQYCRLCSAPFNNPLMAQQHYAGKKHTRNEMRKKLVAEIGTEALPEESSAVGVGNYVCSICCISLTSVEMYQSHMQGNKHQLKETMVVSVIKNSKKTYDSFQDELEDYIKVQKARGLEPKTNFRKPGKAFQHEQFEAVHGSNTTLAFDRDQFSYDFYEPGQQSVCFSEMCKAPYSVEKQCWPPAYKDQLKLGNAPVSHDSTEWYSEKLSSQFPTYEGGNCSPSSAESSDGFKPVSSDNSPSSYRRGQKLQRVHRKGKKYPREAGENSHQQLAKHKRKRNNLDETDSRKEGEKQKRKKGDSDSTTEGKSKHHKNKGGKDSSSEKESRKHKKDKKAIADGPTEEEMLWNESIMGF